MKKAGTLESFFKVTPTVIHPSASLLEPATDIFAGFIPFSADLQQDWIEAGIGGSLQVTPSTTLYGNLTYQTTFDGADWGAGGKIGLRMNW